MKKIRFFLLLSLWLIGSAVQAQDFQLSGRVLDSKGEPIIGANVIIKGTQMGTTTDREGNFSIRASKGIIIDVSFIGYISQNIKVETPNALTIKLLEDIMGLEEVIVVGYGTQKKVNLTGAVSTVSTKDLEGKPVNNLLEALQGVVPGLVIQQSSSNPGSSPSMNIRGLNTLNNNDPLVIIDGIEGSINNLNPSDVDQISILKDASSTAIYGARASNGVILISTKKGSANKTEFKYETVIGVQQPTALPRLADSWVYAELYNEAAVNSGRAAKFTPEDIAGFRNGGPNVNWVKELYKPLSMQQSHNMSLSGGNDKTTFLGSFGYVDQESMFKGPNYGYQRFNGRMNIHHQVNSRLDLTLTSQFARNDIREHAYWTEWIIEQANRMPPIYNIKNPDGTYNYPSGSNSNGLQRLEEGGYRRSVNDELQATAQANLQLFEGFKITGNVGMRMWNNALHENRKALKGTGDQENKLTEQFYRSMHMTSSLLAAYHKQINKHTFDGLVGYSYEGFRAKDFSTSRLRDDSRYDILGGELSGKDVSNKGGGRDWALYSGFARLSYNYDERYMLEFNVRNDYSSLFARGKRGAIFPSTSAGWRISEEEFWGSIAEYVPSLKIRGSWGLVGNNRIDEYQYMQTVTIKNEIGFGGVIGNNAVFSSSNPDLKWETTRMANIGFEVGLLNNDLNITADYFNNKTKDILVQLPVPGMFGNGAPIQNAGVVMTQGWEVAVNYTFKTSKVRHFVSANVSDSRNEVLDINGTEIINGNDVCTIIKEGYPMRSYYSYRWDGLFQNEAEVGNGPHLPGITAKPGDIRYVDKNGDGSIDADTDRFIVGNDFPRYLFALNYGFEWKGLDFSMMWQGVGQRSRWMRGESAEAFHNNNEGPVMDFHVDRWTPNNPGASYPRLTMGSESANNAVPSDFWIQDASYIRLKNAQLGYTFSNKVTRKIFLQNLRIYASVQNALTFTKMRGGWDPEYGADGSGRAYPVARVFSLGLNVNF